MPYEPKMYTKSDLDEMSPQVADSLFFAQQMTRADRDSVHKRHEAQCSLNGRTSVIKPNGTAPVRR